MLLTMFVFQVRERVIISFELFKPDMIYHVLELNHLPLFPICLSSLRSYTKLSLFLSLPLQVSTICVLMLCPCSSPWPVYVCSCILFFLAPFNTTLVLKLAAVFSSSVSEDKFRNIIYVMGFVIQAFNSIEYNSSSWWRCIGDN